ncbi:hypothetical protein LDENG_00122640, partial [Lucifuga dentata]
MTNIPLEVMLMSVVDAEHGSVELLDWFDLGEEVVLVMERPVPCSDLFEFIRDRGCLKEDMAKEIQKQLLDAAMNILSNGVFHRDIKPENILVHTESDVPRVKLIDFGCGVTVTEDSYVKVA